MRRSRRRTRGGWGRRRPCACPRVHVPARWAILGAARSPRCPNVGNGPQPPRWAAPSRLLPWLPTGLSTLRTMGGRHACRLLLLLSGPARWRGLPCIMRLLRHVRKTLGTDAMGHLARRSSRLPLPADGLLTPRTCNQVIALSQCRKALTVRAIPLLESARHVEPLLALLEYQTSCEETGCPRVPPRRGWQRSEPHHTLLDSVGDKP
jgi:hypothetical protein